MFEPCDHPRVFGVPLGVDFPRALVDGLTARHGHLPPESLARVRIIVNTRRMARRIRTLFDQGPARLLPRVDLLTDLGEHWDMAHIPDPVPRLRRRLELTQLVSTLLDRQPDIAPRSSLYALADSLAALMDEMHGEGVSPGAIDQLDITDQSGHWERITAFLGIVRHYFETGTDRPDTETRQRLVIEHLVQSWHETPPDHPVIVAGSTGSRGATRLLMEAVSRLPQGAVILPGFDFDMPPDVWGAMNNAMLHEDHPQYRFADLMQKLDLSPDQIARWSHDAPANSARNRLLSLALRPAPVTDQWLTDGPALSDLDRATDDITLLEAPSTRAEALSIAMRLRQAAEDGRAAALITPDRTLSRQVTAALDRWGILPDDSAGMPLHLSPPGRFLRHVADLLREPLTAELLLTLLKHPLANSGPARGPHLRLTRELELHLRRHGPPYPEGAQLIAWASALDDDDALAWAHWISDCFCAKTLSGDMPLTDFVALHLDLATRIAQGPSADSAHQLWQEDAGEEAWKAVSALSENAEHGGQIGATDYCSLFHSILTTHDVRRPDTPHAQILIWGTLEARVQGADLLILAGLNEGSWPEAPKPDPWLNRALRHRAGLLLPERRIGLSAHDFQQAASAPEVWLTRSIRSDDAETVPSRWLNRIKNLLAGLPEQGGKAALDAMIARGQHWLALAEALEEPGQTAPEMRPAPAPPVTARPRSLSVTEIKRLIRDPYAIYARHVLRLRPLDPLMKLPDALLRGTVLHEILEAFIKDTLGDPSLCTRAALMAKTETVLAQNVPWAEARVIWYARMERVADWFIETELARRQIATPAELEARGKAWLSDPDFTLRTTADRVDIDASGALHIYDYKTGAPPTKDQQLHFDRQLLLEAAIAERAGFEGIAPAPVARATFIGLGSGGKLVDAPLSEAPPDAVWQEFQALIRAYMEPDRGYPSRRAMHMKSDRGDYDQLARFGEWDITDPPETQGVG
ncbi:double-strand break repair protein AddB [Roseovarius halotolerans]|uniref:PD-(D/E)XK nuclease superfamily protein n=1 Tax=Roseovarius halotolerans TaxID=505353 RepID=A0A1X6Z4S2_9RHOB|nr:double-strand break repair protein AddB [Roseovarius halotolerans]RKT32320.1 double-strand break repair protein AddB [Roseovarius halotolerans]SLN38809.1 PD-(D/E)XK nuclease superfamily protein [Roseovarius halotolerans]